MSQAYRFPVKTGAGSEVLPTADATFYTDDIQGGLANTWQAYVEFFSDAEGTAPVTPSGGTVVVQARPMGNNWLAASNSPAVNATACGTPVSAYTPPQFTGRVSKGRVTFSSIAGAAYCRVTFWGT